MRSSSYSTGVCKELSLYSSVTVDEHYHAIIFLAHFVERRIKEGGEFMVAGRSYPVTPRDIVKSREHLETIHQSDPSYLRQGMLAEPQMSQLTRIAIIEMAWGLPIDACIPSSLWPLCKNGQPISVSILNCRPWKMLTLIQESP